MRLSARPETVNFVHKETVKNFILSSTRFERSQWPGLHCLIWKNDKTLRVGTGNYWTMTTSDLYVDGDPDIPVPIWGPAAITAIADFFLLAQDPEIIEAIENMIEGMRTQAQEGVRTATAYSHAGRPIRKIALHTKELKEAGLYNVAPEGEPEDLRWRDHEGRSVDINETGTAWIVMEI
jgi:hypothetical protein